MGKTLTVRLTEGLVAQVKARAEREDRSVSSVVRLALGEYLGPIPPKTVYTGEEIAEAVETYAEDHVPKASVSRSEAFMRATRRKT